jgi:hypothetical protein
LTVRGGLVEGDGELGEEFEQLIDGLGLYGPSPPMSCLTYHRAVCIVRHPDNQDT